SACSASRAAAEACCFAKSRRATAASLLARDSRRGSAPRAEAAYPATVRGLARGWCKAGDGPGFVPTYLGAYPADDDDAWCNGVFFAVGPGALEALIRRESGYVVHAIDPAQVTMRDGVDAPPGDDLRVFVPRVRRPPAIDRPIVQSYVDVCLAGCLEVERTYRAASGFAADFFHSTRGWSQAHWINDRLMPRKPTAHVPEARRFDGWIRDHLGADVLAAIRLP
ncbi:MAG: gamma-glutamylcyclotransferase family protein, partial [Acidobacteriota bacterium]